MTVYAPAGPRLAERRPLAVILLALVGAAALVAVLVMSATQAAWTANHTNEGNVVAAATVELSGPETAVFTVEDADLLPTEHVEHSITVSNTGTRDLDVTLSADVIADVGGLAGHLVVSVGSAPGTSDIYNGGATVSALDAVGSQTIAAGGDLTYHVRITLDPAAPDTLQGAAATFDLVWDGAVPSP
jgi:hypothetical protein